MSGSSSMRMTLAAGALLAAAASGASLAMAQEGPPVPVNFHDPEAALAASSAPHLEIDVNESASPRFAIDPRQRDERNGVELEVAAGGNGSPVDVSVAQRASLGATDDLDRQGRGSELRIGRGLVERRDEASREPSVYMFVASEDEALTWQPGARSEFGGRGSSLALQDRVEVGDVSAGVTYERNGVQASLAYVEREQSTRVGRHTHTVEHDFAGVTVTMRR